MGGGARRGESVFNVLEATNATFEASRLPLQSIKRSVQNDPTIPRPLQSTDGNARHSSALPSAPPDKRDRHTRQGRLAKRPVGRDQPRPTRAAKAHSNLPSSNRPRSHAKKYLLLGFGETCKLKQLLCFCNALLQDMISALSRP